MRRSFPLLPLVAALLALSAPADRALAARAASSATALAKAAGAAAKERPLLDLNSAAKSELMKLPGVSDAVSDRIIAGRPWKSKYDLVIKKVVTRSVYDRFAKLVVARQPESG